MSSRQGGESSMVRQSQIYAFVKFDFAELSQDLKLLLNAEQSLGSENFLLQSQTKIYYSPNQLQ